MANSINTSIHYRSPSPRRNIQHRRLENAADIEKHYTLGKQLGKGSFGSVTEALRVSDNTKWAIKIINKEKAGSAHINLLEHEVKIMKKVNHRNIIHLEEVFETADKMFLIMELCSTGGLDEVLKEKGCFLEQEALGIFKQLTDAVSYMHENDITHRDLKLDNILLVSPTSEFPYFIKLADFGLSYTRGSSGSDYMMMQAVGTPIYMAPEVITNHGYSQQCDIWSIGIVLHTLLSGKAPFIANNEEDLRELIKKGVLNFSTESWDGISPAAKQLIEGMLKVDPAYRLTSKEVLFHPWMKGEQNVNGAVPTNVLEMMKQYRLDLELEQQNNVDEVPSEISLTIDVETESVTSNGDTIVKSFEARATKSASCVLSSPKASTSPIKKVSSKTTVPNYMQPTKSSKSSKTSNLRQNRKK